MIMMKSSACFDNFLYVHVGLSKFSMLDLELGGGVNKGRCIYPGVSSPRQMTVVRGRDSVIGQSLWQPAVVASACTVYPYSWRRLLQLENEM